MVEQGNTTGHSPQRSRPVWSHLAPC